MQKGKNTFKKTCWTKDSNKRFLQLQVVLGPHEGKYVQKMILIPGLQGLSPLKNTDGYFVLMAGDSIGLQKVQHLLLTVWEFKLYMSFI